MNIKMYLEQSFENQDLKFDLDLHLNGITVLSGPSGSGKTTLLRFLAGFFEPYRGFLSVNQKVLHEGRGKVPTHLRRFGYMHQSPSLFPHLSVQENLGFSLNLVSEEQRRFALSDVVDRLGIEPLLKRRIYGLSGGERQRVSLARTLLSSPDLILLDEPLSSLDAGSRSEILPYITRVASESGIPMLYVTHHFGEILHLADEVIEVHDGRLMSPVNLASILANKRHALAREFGAYNLYLPDEPANSFENLDPLERISQRRWIRAEDISLHEPREDGTGLKVVSVDQKADQSIEFDLKACQGDERRLSVLRNLPSPFESSIVTGMLVKARVNRMDSAGF